MRAYIADPKNNLLSFPPLALPLDPTIQVTGIIPERAGMFKSQLLPLHLTFTCLDGTEYPIIFKTGDDLRQDQLVVQIFTLMDRLLRKENLDLRITPYKVLATGIDHGIFLFLLLSSFLGMLQFVPSKAIASILSEYGNSLVPFLAQGRITEPLLPSSTTESIANPSSHATYSDGIERQVLENFVRSTGLHFGYHDFYYLAGYCVMTYLLGIGDRHLDNLLVTPQGKVIFLWVSSSQTRASFSH